MSELAYGTGFENQRGVKSTKGSNPFISSILNGVVGKLVTPPDCKSEAKSTAGSSPAYPTINYEAATQQDRVSR